MINVTRRKFLKSTAMTAAICSTSISFLGCSSPQSSGESDDVIEFIHVTDTHMDLASEDSITNLEAFVKKVNDVYANIDFVLFGGDNFNNNATGIEDAEKFKKVVDELNCDYYLVRGNKESCPADDNALNQADFAEMFFDDNKLNEIDGADWKVQKGNYIILGLDTTLEGKPNGKWSDDTFDFVEKQLEDNENKHFILLNHQTYSNFWDGDEVDEEKYVLNNIDKIEDDILKKYSNVKLTLSGHKHMDDKTSIEDTKAVATVGFLLPFEDDVDNHAFRYIRMKNGNIDNTEIIGTKS